MTRTRKTTPVASLAGLFDRLDSVRMTTADRTYAKAALVQADTVARSLVALAEAAKRVLGVRPLHHRSAHS